MIINLQGILFNLEVLPLIVTDLGGTISKMEDYLKKKKKKKLYILAFPQTKEKKKAKFEQKTIE